MPQHITVHQGRYSQKIHESVSLESVFAQLHVGDYCETETVNQP